ncbi:hypothetical protein BYT27DRAFT_7247035 [Phlegmacium glaucopus]|nr:hypothetical protein BYT27DRAFT_7247035 [Phlegmacium glaucopus]
MTDLPPLQNTMHGSYKIILSLEKSVRSDPGDPKKLIYARILGYLHGPPAQARLAVTLEIISCNGEAALLANGNMYYDLYLCASSVRRFRMGSYGPIWLPQHRSQILEAGSKS